MRKQWFIIGLALPLIISCNNDKKQNVIVSREDLLFAINHAEDGETIYVGDIDFRKEEQLHKSITRINLSKNITIKGYNKNKKSTFTSGSFNLSGTKVVGDYLNVHFENILFDGDIDGSSLTDSSWEYEDVNDIEPRLCQYAMLYKGNVQASYKNCDFNNYMNENGGAFFALYGDYPGNDLILLNYGDNAECKLSIDIDNCNFNSNYAYYGGGAIYIEGNKENVDISIKNTKFEGNKSSCMDFARGGGACFFYDCSSYFNKCSFIDNNGSYSYGMTRKDSVDISDVPPEFVDDYLSSINDQTSGGAIALSQGKCTVINSLLEGNNASLGGGISTYNSKLVVDGCVIRRNTAMCDLLNNPNDSTGPWSMMGLGGAVYINSSDGKINEFWNTSFYENKARNGYGSIYSFYNGPYDGGIIVYPDVNVNFCSFKDNEEIISYDKSLTEWSARSGNGYDIPHIKYNACIVSDELSCSYFEKYEKPSEDNRYSYYTDNAHLLSDKVTLEIDNNNQLKATSKGDISLFVPSSFAKSISSNHYKENEPSKYNIGSNYSPKLFKENNPSKINVPLLIVLSSVSAAILVALSILFIRLNKKKKVEEAKQEVETTITISQNNEDIVKQIENEYKITSREKDVLVLLLQGKKRAEIAKELFLSESAIKKYTASLYQKIGVHSKLELVMKYQSK